MDRGLRILDIFFIAVCLFLMIIFSYNSIVKNIYSLGKMIILCTVLILWIISTILKIKWKHSDDPKIAKRGDRIGDISNIVLFNVFGLVMLFMK